MHHTSYLASLPDLVNQLGVLYHMVESRVKMFHKLTKLHGKLHLLTTQVAANDSSTSVSDVDHTAKLVYEEESSDEEASGDEALPNEDSDHWEEEEVMQEDKDDEEEEEDLDSRTEPKANGDEDMEHENESEEE